MVLNYIWIGFFIVAIIVAALRVILFYGQQSLIPLFWTFFDSSDRDVFYSIVDATFVMAEKSVTIAITLIGAMALWLGFMRIGEQGGAVRIMSRWVSPFFSRLFPGVPKDHPAMGSILMNFTANMLGLDNAATPLGLKAMKELQTLNDKKDTASNAHIMFLVLNTSGLTIIPVSIMAYRLGAGAANPADIFVPILLATFFSTIVGLITVSIFQRINLFQPVVLLFIGIISAIVAFLIWFVTTLNQSETEVFSKFISSIIILGFILFFFILGIRKKINLYETFIEGAKEGFQVGVKIIPYLVAMLVAIGVFRASGTMDFIISGIGRFFAWVGVNTDFVPALPTAFMKPLSGSGARGMMLEAMANYGPDHFISRLACTFQGSTETTFYAVALYYGSVSIRKTRYTITCGLLADLAGIIAAVFIAYIFFH